MPLDINMLRAHSGGNPDAVKESQRRRFASVELVDEIIAKDEEWRSSVFDVDNLKKEKNKAQKEVGVKMKAKEACVELVAKVSEINCVICIMLCRVKGNTFESRWLLVLGECIVAFYIKAIYSYCDVLGDNILMLWQQTLYRAHIEPLLSEN